jgi:lipoate-protein ligase A
VTAGLAFPLSVLSEVSGEPSEKLARSLKAVYRLAIDPIVQALRECGLPAILAEERPSSQRSTFRTADCFAFTSPNDVVHEKFGVKVCGCALKLTQRAVLVQASIPAGAPLVDPARVFAKPSQLPYLPWNSDDFETAFRENMGRLKPAALR